MNNKKFVRIVCLLMAAILLLSLVVGVLSNL